MEHDLWNGLRLRIPEGEVPLGADSLLLADFLTLPPRARVADLGAGCGTLHRSCSMVAPHHELRITD